MVDGANVVVGSTPIPDPTERTNAQIEAAMVAIRDYIDGQLAVRDERLRGIDTATSLRLDALAEVRETLNAGLVHEREITDEKFGSVAQQFIERDTRSEREARDNKVAVDAAFAAQKEAAQSRMRPTRRPSTSRKRRWTRRSTSSNSCSKRPPMLSPTRLTI